ncbi:uncharacterized protein LOC134023503 [Osmerus eperlanus]|uniref:uncharacterized protein LOC134023503 n=1 Tax=Osmerus eperlanus TaxID=29151 RepID=UPI002E134210
MSGNSNGSMISCLTYSCNYSDCYSVSMNSTAVQCSYGYNVCQLKRNEGVSYTLSCEVSCNNISTCNNSQTNCIMSCCNSTGCLNSTLASMTSTTAMTPMKTTTTPTTTKPPTTTTTTQRPNNGKKCHTFQCTTTDCYKSYASSSPEFCSVNLHYCELKKTTGTTWEAGCAATCTGQPGCTATLTTACQQECCNATATSCLKLDGSLNLPSSATRGPSFSFGSIMTLLFFLLGHQSLV